jgi:hypothetical protein
VRCFDVIDGSELGDAPDLVDHSDIQRMQRGPICPTVVNATRPWSGWVDSRTPQQSPIWISRNKAGELRVTEASLPWL